jgi:hypothetical protein
MTTTMQVPGWLSAGPCRIAALVLALTAASGALPALAADVTINVPTTFADADASDGAADGVFNVDGNLTITGTGSITCNDPAAPLNASACPITIVVTGNMEIQGGGSVLANNAVGGGGGADITITVAGDFVLRNGSTISSSKTGSGSSFGNGGNIVLNVGTPGNGGPPTGDFIMEPGAQILANSYNHSGGTITINVARSAEVDGLVQSFGGQGGTGAVRPPGGGRIWIDAGCDLTVSDEGKISSSGRDHGADLVHLEGGCDVKILGLVESTGRGHAVPNSPPNSCNSAFRDDKPAHSTACVEVWAGNLLLIDSTPPHSGEINADTASGPNGISWIDLFARGNIQIIGDTDLPFAAHANGTAGTNDAGGPIRVIATEGSVLMSGLALQSDAIAPGGDGGLITVHARDLVGLDGAFIFARGDFNPTGGLGVGGQIAARSFAGDLGWQNGVGDVRPNATGAIALESCGAAIDTTNTDFNGEVPGLTPSSCGTPAPSVPAYVTLPACACVAAEEGACIQVTKLCADATSPGGQITFFGEVTNCGTVNLLDVTVTDDSGTPGDAGDDVVVFGPAALAPGESQAYQGAYTPASSPSTDTVTATGTGEGTSEEVSATAEATCEVPVEEGDEGCTPGYWGAPEHLDSWVPTGYTTDQKVNTVFDVGVCTTLGTRTLLQALSFGGGNTFCGKVQLLLRAAVAAVLGAAHPGVDYPLTEAEIIADVNAAIASGDATTVIDLKDELDADNNLGCPLN